MTFACAETTNGPLAGASDAWASAPEPTSSPIGHPARAGAVWEGYSEVLRSPSVTSAPFISRGHQPEQLVDIRVSEGARPTYAALVTDSVFPNGTVLAELSHNASGNGFVMRKSGGVWSYFELDAQGALLANGDLALCAGCHAQAPADRVFGLPRGP